MRTLILGALLAGILSACLEPSSAVPRICERLEKSCDRFDREQCLDDAMDLEHDVIERGCDDVYVAYLRCLDAAPGCGWTSSCQAEQRDVDACVDPPPM